MNVIASSWLTDLGSLWPWWLSSMGKVTLWLAAGWLVDRACRRRSASLRHVVAVIGACGVPLVFLVNLSPIPEYAGWQPLKPLMAEGFVMATSAVEPGTQSVPTDAVSAGALVSDPLAVEWPPLVVGLWFLGIGVGAIRLLLRCRCPLEAVGAVAAPADHVLAAALRAECLRLGIRAVPALRLADGAMPMTSGLRRPAIMLPSDAASWPEEKLAAVLRHELAHVRRRDILWTLLSEVALLVVWPHPLGRALRRRIARLREEACDDAVVTTGVPAHDYAEHLASLLPGATRAPSGLGLPAIQCSGWRRRFRRLLDPEVSRRSVSLWHIGLLSSLALLLLTAGTLLVGCTGTRPAGPTSQSIAEPHSEANPTRLPTVRREARRVHITMKVFEIRPKHGATPQEQAKAMGFPDGIPTMGTVLSPEKGQSIFNITRKGVELVTAPVVKARSGQQATIEIGEEVVVPLEFLKNEKTGKHEVAATEKVRTGVKLAVTAEPTANPEQIHLDLDAQIKELESWLNYGGMGFVQPVFYTRHIVFSDPLENGSYIIIGQRPESQTMTQSVPGLGDIPFLGRLFRVTQDQTFIRLAAVQVIVEEAAE